MKAIAQTRLVAMIRSDAQRFEALKREIVHLDYFCKGTVLKRMMKCGNKKCTYKVQNKTVNLKLYPEMTPLYRDAIRQYRKLRLLLGRMERLSRSALAHLAQQKLTGAD